MPNYRFLAAMSSHGKRIPTCTLSLVLLKSPHLDSSSTIRIRGSLAVLQAWPGFQFSMLEVGTPGPLLEAPPPRPPRPNSIKIMKIYIVKGGDSKRVSVLLYSFPNLFRFQDGFYSRKSRECAQRHEEFFC